MGKGPEPCRRGQQFPEAQLIPGAEAPMLQPQPGGRDVTWQLQVARAAQLRDCQVSWGGRSGAGPRGVAHPRSTEGLRGAMLGTRRE